MFALIRHLFVLTSTAASSWPSVLKPFPLFETLASACSIKADAAPRLGEHRVTLASIGQQDTCPFFLLYLNSPTLNLINRCFVALLSCWWCNSLSRTHISRRRPSNLPGRLARPRAGSCACSLFSGAFSGGHLLAAVEPMQRRHKGAAHTAQCTRCQCHTPRQPRCDAAHRSPRLCVLSRGT